MVDYNINLQIKIYHSANDNFFHMQIKKENNNNNKICSRVAFVVLLIESRDL